MGQLKAAQMFWTEFCNCSGTDLNTPYQVWHFGNSSEMAKELSELVLSGKKWATACLQWWCEKYPQFAPKPDGFSVVTDFEGNPKCVIQTIEIRTIPFNEVDPIFATEEGEGDRSLSYWREVHWKYFSKECRELGLEPSESMVVVCERFKLLYPSSS